MAANPPASSGGAEQRLDISAALAELTSRLDAAAAYLRLEDKREDLVQLESEIGAADLWSDPDRARAVTTQYNRVKADVDLLDRLRAQIDETTGLFELASDEGDDTLLELDAELRRTVDVVRNSLDALELRSLFTGEFDDRDAIAEIHAGAGGTDAQDWAEMMLRMYLRWAERRGLDVDVEEVTPGGEAGILSATFVVRGENAYGLLAAERGVHRLVRMSPFDSQHRRQTSFASLDVTPFLEENDAAVDIDEKDLRVDTYRSSGAGGQHINVTDSAVRITHLPTGIVVSCQNERSQLQNKAKAMQVLTAKLAERQRAERRAELEALSGPQAEVAWGNQIRSYVLAPYQLVKDLRTDAETGNVEAVLDGDLDALIVAFLHWRRAQGA